MRIFPGGTTQRKKLVGCGHHVPWNISLKNRIRRIVAIRVVVV